MKLEKLKPGDTVWQVGTYKNGIGRATRGVWSVRVVSVDLEKQTMIASWNTNTPRTFFRREWSKLRYKRPA